MSIGTVIAGIAVAIALTGGIIAVEERYTKNNDHLQLAGALDYHVNATILQERRAKLAALIRKHGPNCINVNSECQRVFSEIKDIESDLRMQRKYRPKWGK